MDKDILVQYCEMKEEIKDLRQRIMKLDKFLQDPPIVADTVTGSRKDLTIGPIKLTGIPDPIYRPKVADRMNRIFPNRNKKYTDENVKKRRQRFFEKIENVPPCPDER